jgi:hypothetical protein
MPGIAREVDTKRRWEQNAESGAAMVGRHDRRGVDMLAHPVSIASRIGRLCDGRVWFALYDGAAPPPSAFAMVTWIERTYHPRKQMRSAD